MTSRLRRFSIFILVAAFCGCAEDMAYHPAPQILPANIKKIGIQMIVNKTDQIGIEDKLTLAIRDAFTADGTYAIVPVEDADGIVALTVQRYVLTPTQTDANLIPSYYKLRVICDLQFIDRAKNQILWEEKNMQGYKTYPAATAQNLNGLTEEQAREGIWATIAQNVETRVVQGFGAYTGTTSRRISADAPSTEPVAPQPDQPITPVTSPY